MGNKGGMLLLISLMITTGIRSVAAGELATSKETVVQGKPLAYWLKELKDPDPLAQEEALAVIAGAGEAAQGAAPVLVELLKDKSPPIRVKAAIVLGKLKGHAKHTAPVLLDAWKDGSLSLRHEILPAFGPLALDHEEILVLLLRASSDANLNTRFLASLGINKSRPGIFAPLAKALDHGDPVVRKQAILHLGSAGKEYVPALNRMLKDADWDIRFQTAYALVRIEKNPRAHFAIILEASAKDDPQTRKAALEILLQMKPPAKEALAAYRAGLKEGPLTTKLQAAEAVWHLTRKVDEVLPIYREVIESAPFPSPAAVAQALTAVRHLGPEAKSLRIPLLEVLKQGKDTTVIQALPAILAGLGPESIPTLVEVAGNLGNQAAPVQEARRHAASRALALLGKDGVQALIVLMDHPSPLVSAQAYKMLPLAGPDARDAVPALRKALTHQNVSIRGSATTTLSRLGPDASDALPDLLDVARKKKDVMMRRNALAALPHLQPRLADILPILEDALEDRDPVLRLAAADWLWHVDSKDARPPKIVAGAIPDLSLTKHALSILVHHRDTAAPAYPAVTELLGNKSVAFRSMAIQTFDRLGIDTKEHQQRLIAALSDPDTGVCVNAALALRKLGVEEKVAVEILVKRLETMPSQSATILAVLTEFGLAAKSAIPVIERMTAKTNSVVRASWIEKLAAIDPDVVPRWETTLEEAFSKYGSIPAAGLLAEHHRKETKYVEFLIEKLRDSPNADDRWFAAMNLAKGGDSARLAVPALRLALGDPHAGVRIGAALALEKLEPRQHKILPALAGALREADDWRIKVEAANALAALGPAAVDAVPALRAAVRDPDSGLVRFAANEALWKIEPKSALPGVFEEN